MDTAFIEEQKMSPLPTLDEQQRKLCFDMFNAYWEDAFGKGIPFDTIGTMSISAALFALVAKHGKETTAEFVKDLAQSILQDQFTNMRPRN